MDLLETRERELATLDENSTSSGIADEKNEWKNRGEEGTTPVTKVCPGAERR